MRRYKILQRFETNTKHMCETKEMLKETSEKISNMETSSNLTTEKLGGSDERRGERKKKKGERRAWGEDDEGRCRGFGKRETVFGETRKGLRREHQRPTESRRGTGREADLNRTAETGTGVLRIGTNTVSRREVRADRREVLADRPGETGCVPVCVVPVFLFCLQSSRVAG
ncbi:hypothetical protein Zmor_023469 [Zophobas morio]|uniref:Uncharacterized protein n=1 Tax=Zophobas morio TaxID=2755281 RepID=A0AA38HYC3_9CUCU|nr:hypothetical protein Zmor_023469 [Zophobas morio]